MLYIICVDIVDGNFVTERPQANGTLYFTRKFEFVLNNILCSHFSYTSSQRTNVGWQVDP